MIATHLGSLPGRDVGAALRLVRDEFNDQFAIPELPARGPSAGMIGRAGGLLDGLAVELQPAGWRLTDHRGRDQNRASALLRDDLDQVEELFGHDPRDQRPAMKLSVCGPWTLAAGIELPRGELVLADSGARRELIDSYALGVGTLIVQLTRRFPGVDWTLQLDEPSLPAVASGALRTSSGFARHRAIEPGELVAGLRTMVDAVGGAARSAVHCCAPELDLDLLGRAGVDTVALDAGLIGIAQFEQLGVWLEAGHRVWWGVLDAAVSHDQVAAVANPDTLIDRYRTIVRTLAIDPELLDRQSALTPSCGLAGWAVPDVPKAFRAVRRAAELALEATS